MSDPEELPARPSLDSLRKQARRLARDAAAKNRSAILRVQAQLPHATFPLSNRDAQLVVAREYGFAGWSQLSAEVHRRLGDDLRDAVSRAREAIQNEEHDELRALLKKFPALVSWRGADNASLLDATTSYAMDCSDAERERTYTRPVAAELLIDAGAKVEKKTWMHVIRTGASNQLHQFARKHALPHTLAVVTALGDHGAVNTWLADVRTRDAEETSSEQKIVDEALMIACRFQHRVIALQLLDRAIALDPDLGHRVLRWQSREAFVDFLSQHPGILWHDADTTPWQRFVILQLTRARDANDLVSFHRWLDDEPWVRSAPFMRVQTGLILPACYQKDRGAFIEALIQHDPAILHVDSPPPTKWSPLAQALSYGNAHLIPLLTRIWPMPDDLPHAAGVGDAISVARWFDVSGAPALGLLANHYPHNDPHFARGDLHWGPPSAQQTLDVALAWSVLNKHFAIATFLLERGANINTDWATHEPASILHEAAVQGNEDAVRFLIDHGVDLMKTDYRYHGTAEGWARHGSNDEQMAELLASARRERS